MRLLIAVVALAVVGRVAAAQRYRVLVGGDGGERTILEFRPCVPAEGSACGGWIDREAAPDTTTRLAPATSATFGPGDSLWLEHGAMRIRTGRGASKTISDPRGAASALAVAPMRDYAFVVLRKPDASASTIVMVDLSTRSVIASCPVPVRASAIAVMR